MTPDDLPWFTVAELAAMNLPGMPSTKRGMQVRSDEENWRDSENKGKTWRDRQASGGGIEYTPYVLPLSARVKVILDASRSRKSPRLDERKRADLWENYDRCRDDQKERAQNALRVLQAVHALQACGTKRTPAVQMVSAQESVSERTIYGWLMDIAGVPECDWMAALAPKRSRVSSTRFELDQEAWDFFWADWGRLSQPNATDCYERLGVAAAKKGWKIPSKKTLERRLKEMDPAIVVAAREGDEALKRLYPAQVRDRCVYHALEAVNADGHKWDVFVRWPGVAEPVRPVMVAFQDLFSGMILSWRVDLSENKEAVRLAFGDMVENWGIPKEVLFDNGRNFASKWLTGGTPNRYRFKVRDEEPQGIITQLGINVTFATPYHGQAKPIERAFRDFAGGIAKHPAFEGAYTGNSPTNKPANYGNRAVPLDEFLRVVSEGIRVHNERAARDTRACQKKYSFMEVFKASYEASEIRKATSEQRRLWLLAAEGVTVNRTDGTIALEGNRFWNDELLKHRGKKCIVRFDPANLHAPAFIYRLDGSFICEAECREPVGFNDKAASQAHNRARSAFMKATKARLKATKQMSLQEVVELSKRDFEEEEAPESKVVRPFFNPPSAGNTAVAISAAPDVEFEDGPDPEELAEMRRTEQLRENLKLLNGGRF